MSSYRVWKHDKFSERRPALLDVLRQYPDGITSKAVAHKMAINERTAYRYLKLMVGEGTVSWASTSEAHYRFMLQPNMLGQGVMH